MVPSTSLVPLHSCFDMVATRVINGLQNQKNIICWRERRRPFLYQPKKFLLPECSIFPSLSQHLRKKDLCKCLQFTGGLLHESLYRGRNRLASVRLGKAMHSRPTLQELHHTFRYHSLQQLVVCRLLDTAPAP